LVLLAIAAHGCVQHASAPTSPVRIPSAEAPAEAPSAERIASTGRIEGALLVDDGVLVTLDAAELESIQRCHRAGRPFGWALLSVTSERTISVVESEPGVGEAAGCARSSLTLRRESGEVLVYLRFL
jgi:hypothetical protein